MALERPRKCWEVFALADIAPTRHFPPKTRFLIAGDEKIVLIYFRVVQDKIKAGHDRVHVASPDE